MRKFLSLTTLLLWTLQATALTAAEAPAPALPPVATPEASPAAALASRHVLQAVRLRPYADSLRLIFLFDHPAPYTLKEDLAGQRATLEFLNSALSSLPAELAQIKDPRLSGVWLKQHDGGLVTLELRFPTAAVRLEHFAMEDPAAVVIDVFRTDGEVARISAAPEETTLTPPPAAAETHLTSETQPALPQPRPAIPMATGSRGSVLPLPEAQPDPAPAVPLPAATPETTATAHLEQAAPPTVRVPLNTPPANTLTHGESDPLDADYDYFPLSALRLSTPAALAVRDDFLGRRWATVIKDGLQFMEKNKMGPETGDVLHMIAEATWQLSALRPQEPLTDVMNMYQQAMRVNGSGDLGAFAASRLASAAMLGHDFGTALGYLSRAATSSREAVRRNATLMHIQSLEAMHNYDQALTAIKSAIAQTSATGQQVKLLVKAGDILAAKADYPAAWASYQQASTLDPKFLNLYVKSGLGLVRTALETGHLEEAKAAVLITFNFYEDEDLVNLSLLYAEVLRRLGNVDAAEEAYFTTLRSIETRPNGPEILQRMYKRYPDELLAGESRYGMLFLQTGQVRESMAELKRAYDTAQREGLPLARLETAFQSVLPIFMEQSVSRDRPSDAFEAWRAYHHLATSDTLRRRCLFPLARALEKLNLYTDALKVVRELRENTTTSDTVAPGDLALQEGRLLLKSGAAAQAVPLLEELQRQEPDGERQTALYALLAEAYLKANMSLEAAQALQSLAALPGVPIDRRIDNLRQAGEIFLQNAMPVQSIELGLKGLLQEKQAQEKPSPPTLDPAGGNALRLMLAKAYQAHGEVNRQQIVLDDLLRRPGVTPEQKAEIQILLSGSQRQEGRISDAEEIYKAVAADPAAEANWRDSATQMQKMIEWNRKHPDQLIDLNGPPPVK